MFLSNLFEERLAGTFHKYGKLIARNPVSAIIFAIMLNGLLGIHILWMRSNKDLTVYIPSKSPAYLDSKLVRNYFPDFTGTNFYDQSLIDLGRYGSIIIKSSKDENILNETLKKYIKTILKTVEEISIEHDDQTYLYQNLCALRNSICVASYSVLYSDYFWKQVSLGNVTFPIFVTEYGKEEILDQTLGDVKRNADGQILFVRALKINFYLRQDLHESNVLASKWEQKFIDILQSFISSAGNQNISIAFANSDSLGKELDANTGGDIIYFSLTFTLMITYASFVATGGNCVSNTGHLGRAGVVASGLSILGALGLGSALKVEFVNIVGVMPFLIMGIGVDDMFILMSGLASAPLNKSNEERVGRTMQSSAVAITITSLTNVTAFAIGMLSSFQSVRNFCIYTGLAVLLCYVNHMTFFLGCMTIHERRVAAQRHCITCLPTKSKEEMNNEGRNCLKITCCGGSPPSSRSEQESVFQKFPSIAFPKLVLWLPFKILVIVGFLVYLGFSIWGVVHLKHGLLLRNLVSESSYYHSYSIWDYDLFPSKFIISLIFPSNINYESSETQNVIEDILTEIKQDQSINTEYEINWLNSYRSSNVYDNSSGQSFGMNLKEYISNTSFSNDVIFSSNFTISYSRVHIITNDIKDSYMQGELMLKIRQITEKSDFRIISFSPAFIYFEQYVAVLPNTLQTVGIGVAAVLIVTCIFLSHPLVILIVTMSVALIMLGIFGFMHLWGLSLSSITMIHIIMSVGFSVDYTTHICHAFLNVGGENRNERVNEALILSGGPIFNGAMSSLVGIIMLAFSESYVFNSFLK
ncbi:unnamed protein product [Mytilus coruscus]|uniref:SSD domain-containing protein n=1 Tax=Mytilus coruscus TaxID=42192 RepID=A0A6J8F1A1_MYTCO|nr:unnamed protein product [Mytilus coruscus]